MTVNANPAVSGPYLTDGVTRAWPFGFKIVDASHIKVVAVNIATGVETEYKVGLVVPPGDINQDNGGAVTYPAAPTAALPTGFEIYTVRDVPFSQPNQIGNQGNFFPETHEKTFDLLAMQNQQTLEIARRAVIAGYGQDPSTFVDDLLEASAEAVAAAQAAAADAVQTAADRVQTGLDRIQTGLDRVATAADRMTTDADRVQTGIDKAATAADRVQTDLDRTAASGFASATAADRIQTGLDVTATAADRVATGQDRVATAADRVQTGLDRAAAAASAASVNPAVVKMDSRPNLVVNGAMQDAFENPGSPVLTANNAYPAEQFFLNYSASGAGLSVQLLNNVKTLLGNDRVVEIKCTTAKPSLGANDFVALSTVIEGSRPEWKAAGFGAAGAKPFVFEFELALPAGTIHVHAQNSAGNRHISIPIVVPAGDAGVAKRRTVAIPADTTGTWLTAEGSKGIVIDIVLAAGATLTGGTASTWGATARLAATTQFNILSSTSNVARIADVGLKNDPDATAVYGLFNLMEQNPVYRSERYFFKTFPPAISPQNSAGLSGALIATSYATGGIGTRLQYPVQMAKLPAVSTYNPIANNASWRDVTNATDRAISANQAGSVSGVDLLAATSGPSAAFNYIHATANARL